ncbi:hypothetical protein OXX59_004918 [Metschnikowia pulcherrima]
MQSLLAYILLVMYTVTGVQGMGKMYISLVNSKSRKEIENNGKNTFLFDDNGTITWLESPKYAGFSDTGEFVLLDFPYFGFDLTSIEGSMSNFEVSLNGSMSNFEVSLNGNSLFYLCSDQRIFLDKRCSGARAARITYVEYL